MGLPGGLIAALLRELPRGTTVRSMAAEFGPPPAVHFAAELAGLTDLDLICGPQRLAPVRPETPALTSPRAGLAVECGDGEVGECDPDDVSVGVADLEVFG